MAAPDSVPWLTGSKSLEVFEKGEEHPLTPAVGGAD